MQNVINKLEEDIDLVEASNQIRNLNTLIVQSMLDS
jgi:transcription antitermination factor NusA-like protein